LLHSALLILSVPYTLTHAVLLLYTGPGLHFVLCPLKSIVGRLSLRIQQLDVLCETKTRDNVFVQVLLFFIVL